jgi:GH15 family glucan-1,4-alpha-glucosidase
VERRIEDYAMLSDCQRAALVHRDGSIDWLCFPRFDSASCFSALLGDDSHGRWQIGAATPDFQVQREYLEGTLVLKSTLTTRTGCAVLTEALIIHHAHPLLVRRVEGVRGEVDMQSHFVARFDYGSIVPWVRKTTYGLSAVAGPDELHLQSPVLFHSEPSLKSRARWTVKEGESYDFALTYLPANSHFKPITELSKKLDETVGYWKQYASRCNYGGPYRPTVLRSLLTLKGLTYEPSGGIVAAPTTSLPETLGGERNWDYRFCWIRDSTFSMYALLTAGYTDEAQRWREWLVRAVAGTPSQVNIMYGLSGERRLTEVELSWLPGYEKSRPVRTGNAAYQQLQLDVFGEALDTLYLGLKSGLPDNENSWRVQTCFLDFLEKHWDQPDEGIWEVRGPRQHFTHSKVMAWVAVDRAIRSAELRKFPAPLEKWKALRERIHEDVCAKGYDKNRGAFTQYYGSKNLDASLLMIPIVGFLPPQDLRVIGTVEAIERELYIDGFVLRYKTDEVRDVLHGREGSFLACSFWLADCWILMGYSEKAKNLFERLVQLCNDVGLMSEEYDTRNRRLIGNFPQALSHIALINTAYNLHKVDGPAQDRSKKGTI